MDRRFFAVLEWFRASFWAAPAVLAIFALLAAWAAAVVEERYAIDETWLGAYLYSGGPSDARALLSTLSGSTITVTGVVFSVTVLALSFASSHLGPRLLRVFMEDRGTQVALGCFVGTYIYQATVLATIRGSLDTGSVPRLGVSLALVLAVGSFGVLIYFIHHVAISIQVDHVVDSVRKDLERTLDRLFPDTLRSGVDEDAEAPTAPSGFSEEELSHVAESPASGYVQAIDFGRLETLAKEHDTRIRCEVRPGHFVVEGQAVARTAVEIEDVERAVCEAFVLGQRRTGYQDIEFCLDQLVEIALRSLSTGVNDPFTAIHCIDLLGAALARLARRATPAWTLWAGQSDSALVASPAVTFEGAMGSAWEQLRQHGADQPAVAIRMLEALRSVTEAAAGPERRRYVLGHASRLEALVGEWPDAGDREAFEERYRSLVGRYAPSR